MLLTFYQKYISPLYHWLGRIFLSDSFGCRFTPTCSDYFRVAVKKHGIIQGSLLGTTRLLKCNGLFKGGYDPVPDKIK